ncbi:hypothetical protein O6H91_Y225000 [Diphasiastrum complanatum]|nr:hypothetical protein O6H91_Y225000 [Diphasiastrum complanatum]
MYANKSSTYMSFNFSLHALNAVLNKQQAIHLSPPFYICNPLILTAERFQLLTLEFLSLSFIEIWLEANCVCATLGMLEDKECEQSSEMAGESEESRSNGEELVLELDTSEQEYAEQWGHKPRHIALFVEPSPFAYVSGYKNRFQNFIRYLREMGDEVLIVTTDKGLPQEFYGARIVGSRSFPCPWYTAVPLSLALSPRIFREISEFKPDIIHASSPGIMVFGALAISKMLNTPLVMSYHTHVPLYIPKYTFSWLVKPMWLIIKLLHGTADLTLVTSHALGKELKAAGVAASDRIRVWRKGVDAESFHPRFKNLDTRIQLTDGEPERPLIVHVGRLGAEKNLEFLKSVLDRLPDARLAFIGDGPYRPELERIFADKPVVFTGMLQGEELSKSYASGDIFITPSESETLGLVVLEAMASGVPVVAARAGGIPDIVNQDGETGFLFIPGDVDDCVNKLKALIDCPELRRRIGAAARADVEKFDWRASTKQVRNDYSTAVWFWQQKKKQVVKRFSWLFSRFQFRSSRLKLEAPP